MTGAGLIVPLLLLTAGCASGRTLHPFPSRPAWASGTTTSGGDGVVRLFNFDRDGDLDRVTCNPDPMRWVIYENEDHALKETPTWESEATSDCDHISVVDFNQDGWLDLAGTHESNCTLFLNRSGQFSARPDWKTGFTADANQVCFGDYDSDGDVDMLMAAGNPLFGVGILENTDGILSREITKQLGPLEYCEAAIFADCDADGDLDVVAAYADGRIICFENSEGTFGRMLVIHRDNTHAWTQRIYVTDLDSDGYVEILCAKGFWPSPAPSVLLSVSPTHVTADVKWKNPPKSDYHGFAFGDVDGNGDVGLVAADWGRGGQQGVHVFLSDHGTLAEMPDWILRTKAPAHEVALGDIDGDGDLYLAVGGKDQVTV